jgi:hypothetical protein
MKALVTNRKPGWVRRWEKESYGDDIARRLNAANPSPNALRVKTLIESLRAISEKTSQLAQLCRGRGLIDMSVVSALAGGRLSDYELNHPEVSPHVAEVESLISKINSSLWRYHWRPAVDLQSDGTMYQSLQWPEMDEESSWENSAVHWILSDLPTLPDATGIFSQFKKCARCGDWFYAGRQRGRFCKPTCRVLSHTQTEEGRKARASYMRQHRKRIADLKRGRGKASTQPDISHPSSISKRRLPRSKDN